MWLLVVLLPVVFGAFRVYDVTRRNYPFVDPSRCRHPDFCGLSPEWDLKFGRPIAATIYFPGNATHIFNVTGMNVLIFGALKQEDEFHQILTNISSAGNVVISVHLENEQQPFDYIQDLLRVAFNIYYEHEMSNSHFYGKLSGSTVIAGYGEIADRIIYISDDNHFVHSSIKGIISLSPALWRDKDLLITARNLKINNILFIAGTTDVWRPVSNQRPIYTQVRSANVCKTYIEMEGGNHCYFVDYIDGITSNCYSHEIEYPSFKMQTMAHQYQLNKNARILLEYMTFVSHATNQSATQFQEYLIDLRDTSCDIQYLQSCYVENILFAHDTYFPRDTEQKEYRRVV